MPKAIVFYLEGENNPWTAVSRPEGPFSVRIGRGAESDLMLPQDKDLNILGTVSRVHARIYGAGAEIYLEDLGSQNFTSVDDQIVLAATPIALPTTVRLGSLGIKITEEELKQTDIATLRRRSTQDDSSRSDTVEAFSVQDRAWTQLRESGRWVHALVQMTNLVTRCQRAEDFLVSLQDEFALCFGADRVSVNLSVEPHSTAASFTEFGFDKSACAKMEAAVKRPAGNSSTQKIIDRSGNRIAWIVQPMKGHGGDIAALTVAFEHEVPSHVHAPAANAFVTQAIWIAQVLVNLLTELEAGRASTTFELRRGPSSKATITCEEEGLWGESEAFKRCIYEAEVAATRYVNLVERPGKISTVFIQGESGSGKSALARFAHRMSKRAEGPFVDLNCSAIPVTLAESELFGFERGAHDKAFKSKPGQFELAAGGSLFLDEIGKTSLDFQSKLLKVLDTGVYARIGGTRPLNVDCNVYVAESEDAQAMCDRGQMLPELWYRIRAFTINVPPLRERPEDIEIIANQLVNRLNCSPETTTIKSLSKELIRAFCAYSWPGNIRELSQAVEVGFALCPPGVGEIALTHLPDAFKSMFGIEQPSSPSNSLSVDTSRSLDEVLGDLERAYFVKLLAECEGNVSEVTRRSGKSYNTVQSKLKDLRKWIAATGDELDGNGLETLRQLAGDFWTIVRQ